MIANIYETALRPAAYDDFMADWGDYIGLQTERLIKLKGELGESDLVGDDPEIESHFNRAFELQEAMGRIFGDASPPEVSSRKQIRIHRDGSLECLNLHPAIESAITASIASIALQKDRDKLDEVLRRFSAGMTFPAITIIEVAPTIAEAMDTKHLIGTLLDIGNGNSCLCFRRFAISMSEEVERSLRDSFSITDKELEIISATIRGMSVNDFAEHTGRSKNTVRTQMKSILAKTAAKSQADLVRIVLSLHQVLPNAAPTLSENLHLGERDVLQFDNLPAMPVHTLGPVDGQPVVFIHGMLDGIAVTTQIADLLQQHSVRLIAPIRPNFGDAGQLKRLRTAPEVFSAQFGELLKRKKLERPILIGHMAGSVYAFRCASHYPRRVKGIISVSGGVPIRSVKQFSMMSSRQRTVAYTARFAPSLLPPILRAGISQIDGDDVSRFVDALYQAGTIDRATLSRKPIYEAIVEGFRFAVRQGHRAFQGDSMHVVRDWSSYKNGLDCPVIFVHGRDDPVVHIDTVYAFAKSLGRIATVKELPSDGQLLFYNDPSEIFRAINELR